MRLKKGNQGFLLLFLMGICMLAGCNFGSSVDEKADNEVQIDAVCEEKTESSTEEQMKEESEYFAALEDMLDACLLGDEVNYSQVSSNEVAEINESASVSDSNFTITLGMLFKDFHYDEEEIPSDVVVNNHGGTEFVDGRAHEWYFHTYTDLTINTSDYIPVMNDMSGENIYIITIVLKSPRFCTSKGIRVGATIDELKEVYGSENLELLEEDVPERIRYRYVDGSVQMDFYIKEEQVRKITLHY